MNHPYGVRPEAPAGRQGSCQAPNGRVQLGLMGRLVNLYRTQIELLWTWRLGATLEQRLRSRDHHPRARSRAAARPRPGRGLGAWRPVLAWYRRGPAHRLLGQIAYRVAGGMGAGGLVSGVAVPGREVSMVSGLVPPRSSTPPTGSPFGIWRTVRIRRSGLSTRTTCSSSAGSVSAERVSATERQAELDELSRADLVIAITPADADAFRSAMRVAPRIETIGMGVDLSYWSRSAVARSDGEDRSSTTATWRRRKSSRGHPSMHGNPPAVAAAASGGRGRTARCRSGTRRPKARSDPGVRVTGTVEDPRIEFATGVALCTVPARRKRRQQSGL